MEANKPLIFIKGLDEITKKDLKKFKSILERDKFELIKYKEALSYQIQKKKHYKSLIGKGKYDDDSMKKSIVMINVDIRQISDKVKLTNDAIAHHTLIVDTLSKQLDEYYKNLEVVNKFKEGQINASSN
jgi:hypothetical protein